MDLVPRTIVIGTSPFLCADLRAISKMVYFSLPFIRKKLDDRSDKRDLLMIMIALNDRENLRLEKVWMCLVSSHLFSLKQKICDITM